MREPLQNKTVWLTGASSGIGRALATTLLERGNRVIVSGRSRDKLEHFTRQWPELAQVVSFDMTDPDDVARAREELFAAADYLDLVILNAGTALYIDAREFDADVCRKVMRANFEGTCNCIELALPLLQSAPTAPRLSIVGSLSAYAGLPRAEVYGASKAALNYLADSLRVDLWRDGIRVSIINPGFVKTPLTDRNDFDMPFLQSSEEAATEIIKGLEKGKTEIRFPFPLWSSLRLLGMLPKRWQARMAQRMVRN